MRRISLPLWLVSAFLYIFLYAPIVVVIVYSFNASRYGGPWRGFTSALGYTFFFMLWQGGHQAAEKTRMTGLPSFLAVSSAAA